MTDNWCKLKKSEKWYSWEEEYNKDGTKRERVVDTILFDVDDFKISKKKE